MADRSLAARAQQIIHVETTAGRTITLQEALKKAIDERCGGDYARAVELAVSFAGNFAREAKKATFVLPEQPSLFDVPAVIAISTPTGDLFINSDDASEGQIDQWSREALQYHGGQHKRFKMFRSNLKALSFDPSQNFKQQAKAIRADKDDEGKA